MANEKEKIEVEIEKQYLDNFLHLAEGKTKTEKLINLIDQGVQRKLEGLALQRGFELIEK